MGTFLSLYLHRNLPLSFLPPFLCSLLHPFTLKPTLSLGANSSSPSAVQVLEKSRGWAARDELLVRLSLCPLPVPGQPFLQPAVRIRSGSSRAPCGGSCRSPGTLGAGSRHHPAFLAAAGAGDSQSARS